MSGEAPFTPSGSANKQKIGIWVTGNLSDSVYIDTKINIGLYFFK